MDFISSKCIIHRDLATRNILVNELGVCKIAGFGLASGVVDERQYRYKIKGRLPIRWLAPETIDGTNFTTKSDVWSFGILLWEIVTMGNKPYPDMCEWEVTSSLQKGYRMPNPPHCDKDLYATMLSCWSADPQNRPGFSELKTMLFKLVKDEKIYIDVQAINPIDSKKLQNEDGESC
ncbi:tyrosine-protein kinase receptor Tie-1-like [Ptychodera flava]|uniref:tyrosine-protein kinase receptor Tie-1-like n=1 Tax=Ptychodera flava TaxID=63121 RepID=UPI00396A9CD4